MHILCVCFFKLFTELLGQAFFLYVKNILRAPLLLRTPLFYTAHARLISKLHKKEKYN